MDVNSYHCSLSYVGFLREDHSTKEPTFDWFSLALIAAFRVHSFPTIILWCLLNQLTWKLRCCKIPSLSKSSLGMASTVLISPSFYAKEHCPLLRWGVSAKLSNTLHTWVKFVPKWHNSIGGSELSYNFFRKVQILFQYWVARVNYSWSG